MTKKRFTVAVYDENAINGFTVLDLEKPNSSKRLKYENVYIGSKVSCEIVCNFGNSLTYENEELKQRNNRQYEQLGRLYDLIEQKEWRVLIDIIDDFKKSDEQLQKEWGTYGDVE